MSAPADNDIAHWLDEAATGIVADADLREQVGVRARHKARRARAVMAASTVVLVIAVAATAAALVRNPQVVTTPGSAGSPPSGSEASAAAGPAIDWSTNDVAFTAESLEIEAGGATFVGAGEPSDPGESHSDPGTATYTTLERTWHENGVEMRMNIYFKADGSNWWSDEIRTYDSSGDHPDWITYHGDFFRTPLGKAFTGDLALPDQAGSHDGDGRFLVHGLNVRAFLPPACTPGAAPVTIDLAYPEVRIEAPGSGFGVNVDLLGADCAPMTDPTGYRFAYTPATDGIVTIVQMDPAVLGIPVGSHADLDPEANGETDVRIDVRRTGDEAVVATATMHVTVNRPDLPAR